MLSKAQLRWRIWVATPSGGKVNILSSARQRYTNQRETACRKLFVANATARFAVLGINVADRRIGVDHFRARVLSVTRKVLAGSASFSHGRTYFSSR